MFINNNFRFSPLCIWKILHPNILECKYAKENINSKNYIDTELKSESDSDSDSDNDIDNEE